MIEDGAHEQRHRLLKAETTRPVAATRQGQQHRTTCGVQNYNQIRPHQALAQAVPASRYRKSSQRWSRNKRGWEIPATWEGRQVRSNGQIK